LSEHRLHVLEDCCHKICWYEIIN